MTDVVFPTGFTRLSGPTLAFTVYADNGTSNGWVTLQDIVNLVPSGGTTYTLPIATTSTLGGVKQGSGVTIANDGTISAAAGSSLSGITIDGATIPATTSAPYQMAAVDRVVDVNKGTGAATKILLPIAPTLWSDYTIIDGRGDAGTNNITVALAAGTINGAANFVLNANHDSISFRAVSNASGTVTWRIV